MAPEATMSSGLNGVQMNGASTMFEQASLPRKKVSFIEHPPARKLERVVSAEEWQLEATGLEDYKLENSDDELFVPSGMNRLRGLFGGCIGPQYFCHMGSFPPDPELGSEARKSLRLGKTNGDQERKPRRRWGQWLQLQLSSPVLVTRLVMMALLVIITVVLSVGTWYATGLAYNNAVNRISEKHRQEIVLRSRDYFYSYLDHGRVATTTFTGVLETMLGFANTSDFTPLALTQLVTPLAWAVFRESRDQLSTLAYLQLDRRVVAYQQPLGSNATWIIFSNSSSSALPASNWYQQLVDTDTGLPASPAIRVPPYSIGEGMKYINGVLRRRTVGWDLIVARQGPMLVCGQAVEKATTVAGLSVVASNMDKLNKYLEAISFKGATIYVVTSDGSLVASSTNVPNFQNTSGTVTLINATDVTDLKISKSSQYLKESYSMNYLLNNTLAVRHVDIAGVECYINSAPLLIDNLQMVVVIVITRNSIMGSIDSERSRILLIECLAALGVLLLGWAVTVFLTLYVSMRMRPKEELLKQQEETQRAQAASEVKSQFLANISHDLRTPMAGILGLLDIMLCDRLTAEQEANLRQMKSCAASLLGLLNNLLDLAKVEAGKMQLEVLEFDIVGELESLVDMFSVQGLGNGTEIALDLADDVERTVKGDPSRVRQVFANLLSNACKFTKEGHVLVRGWMQRSPPPHLLDRTPKVSEESPPSDGKKRISFIFEVDDTGPGIPAHKRELVFEKFQQADLSTTRTHGGTGLGLGIVRSLVKLMGGHIAVVDKDGRGACFRFDLTFECLDQTSNWKNSIVQPEFLLPKLSSVEGGQVLLAMKEDSAGAVIASGWMERRGLHVWRVTQWEDIGGTVASMLQHRCTAGARGSRSMVGFSAPLDRRNGRPIPKNTFSGPLLHPGGNTRGGAQGDSSGSGASPQPRYGASQEEPSFRTAGLLAEEGDSSRLILAIIDASLIPNPFQFLAEELHVFRARLQAQGVVIAWLVEHNTTAETRRALRRSGCAVASKPLYASRMAPLLALATARKGIAHTTTHMDMQPAGGSVAQQWQAESRPSFLLPGPKDGQGPPVEHQAEPGPAAEAPKVPPRLEVPPGSPSPPNTTPTATPPPASPQPQTKPPLPASQGEISPRPLAAGSAPGTSPGQNGTAGGAQLRMAGRTRSLSSPKKQGPGGDGNFDDALRGLHVLIAEDTPLLKKVAMIRMQKLGCTVVTVSDGKEAVDAVLATYRAAEDGEDLRRFDAVLMDCQMPVLDGYGATATIREAERGSMFHTPIIALTAHAMTSDERKCLDAGMDAYLTKPIDPALMATTILRLIKSGEGGEGEGEEPNPLEPPQIAASGSEAFPTPSRPVSLNRTSSEVTSRHVRTNSMNIARERYLGKS